MQDEEEVIDLFVQFGGCSGRKQSTPWRGFKRGSLPRINVRLPVVAAKLSAADHWCQGRSDRQGGAREQIPAAAPIEMMHPSRVGVEVRCATSY